MSLTIDPDVASGSTPRPRWSSRHPSLSVGSGDAFGSGGRFQTCIALAAHSADAPSVLLDCGATSLTALHQQQIDPNQIEAVLVTHLHGDHFGGLPFLVLDGQFRRRTHDLTVFGPPGTRTRLEQAMEILFPGSSGVQRRFAVHVVEYADRRTLVLGRCASLHTRSVRLFHGGLFLGADPAGVVRVWWRWPRGLPTPAPRASRSGGARSRRAEEAIRAGRR